MPTATRPAKTAMPWALLRFGSDAAVCVHAFSGARPRSATLTLLRTPIRTDGGGRSRLRLTLERSNGKTRKLLLEQAAPDVEDAIGGLASVIVVEEDAEAPKGRRHAYVAQVKLPPDREVLDEAGPGGEAQ